MLNFFARGSSSATKLAAFSQFQGWIEFAPSGEVLDVNERLCAMFGYSRADVIGKPHRALCHPRDVETAEYEALWRALRAGERSAGVFVRRHKDGRDVWLQATYQPIKKFGRVVRIIKFASDITTEHSAHVATACRLAAMDATQAIIEFDLDGKVVDANAAFLTTMKYEKSQILGRHHRIFCDATYAQSTDYQKFWQALRAGEAKTGRYPRRASDGSEVWIQGAYNPLRNARGEVYGVIKACHDVTQQVRGQAATESFVAEAGHLLSQMAQGDLTSRMEREYDGELARVSLNLNQTVDSLASTLGSVREVAFDTKTSVQQMTHEMNALSGRTHSQVSAIEEAASSLEEMSASVQLSAQHAQSAAAVGGRAQDAAQHGGRLMEEVLTAMRAIDDSGKRIGAITRIIDELAFQTNLLSLNAAVEAARAGDHGRGFAVVADEVRALALRSSKASSEIAELIQETLGRVKEGGRLMNETSDALRDITSSVAETSTYLERISATAQEQAIGIRQINAAVSALEVGNQQNAVLAEELTAASQSLDDQAARLTDEVASFVTESAASTPVASNRGRDSQSSAPTWRKRRIALAT